MVGAGGVLCPGCRSVRATESALFSASLGPWGLPWGILYSIRALVASVRGGEFSRLENAQLLRHQGIAYFQRGMRDEAFTNFTNSLKFEKNDAITSILAEPFFKGAISLKKPGWLRGQSIGLASFAIPLIILFLFGLWSSSSPSNATSERHASSTSADNSTPYARPLSDTSVAMERTCIATKNVSNQRIYDTCKAIRPEIRKQVSDSTEKFDKDDFTVIGAQAELSQAIAAYQLGRTVEAKKLGEEALQTLKTIKEANSEPKARKRASEIYNCYKLNQCSK